MVSIADRTRARFSVSIFVPFPPSIEHFKTNIVLSVAPVASSSSSPHLGKTLKSSNKTLKLNKSNHIQREMNPTYPTWRILPDSEKQFRWSVCDRDDEKCNKTIIPQRNPRSNLPSMSDLLLQGNLSIPPLFLSQSLCNRSSDPRSCRAFKDPQ